MICPETNQECLNVLCQYHCLIEQTESKYSKRDFTQTKAEHVVIPCILIATKLLATEEQQKRLEDAMLRMSGNFIQSLLNALENDNKNNTLQ